MAISTFETLPARCLPPFWAPSQYRQRLSVLRDEHWDRLKGCRVADAVIKAVLAALRNTVIGLLRCAGSTNMAAACRRLAAQPLQALALIGIALEN